MGPLSALVRPLHLGQKAPLPAEVASHPWIAIPIRQRSPLCP